jgi:hypothetical protein
MTQEAQTPEVKKFLADADSLPFTVFYLVMMDGSFFPPSTDVASLDEMARTLGVAGFAGVLPTKDGEEATVMLRPWGIESADAAIALASVEDAITKLVA